ncbi:MAG: DUF3053 family protein [Hyphomicrobiales bacterium]|nr:DUF3053 family protein [Hyphomicrobiales bacterium]MBV9054097.1 DUF3053 family protein [Hyphomicrobiales bacterium]MBV9976325.1 DUF3053 family protein [Hyphomicrobiales bacterium]
MTLTLTRQFLVVGLLAAFGLAACGDDEASQRKAFTEFLQTRILDKPGLHVPKPNDEQMKAFGAYAKDYGIILSFNEGMDKNVTSQMEQVFKKGMVRSVAELMTRRADITTAMEGMRALRAAIDAELAKADAAHAALKQPDDVKPVYDKAYERTVTAPASSFKDVFPAVDGAFQAAQNFVSFLDQHHDGIKIEGNSIQTNDPKLNGEINRLINALNQNSQAVLEAQRKLQATIRGS